MIRVPSRSVKFALLALAVCASCAAAASCSQDGVTTNCPALPLYQTFPLGDAAVPDAMSGDSPASQQALAAAVDAGCATAPNGKGVTVSSGGKGGGGGSGGAGGKAGSGGKGGLAGADNAGAAGSN